MEVIYFPLYIFLRVPFLARTRYTIECRDSKKKGLAKTVLLYHHILYLLFSSCTYSHEEAANIVTLHRSMQENGPKNLAMYTLGEKLDSSRLLNGVIPSGLMQKTAVSKLSTYLKSI